MLYDLRHRALMPLDGDRMTAVSFRPQETDLPHGPSRLRDLGIDPAIVRDLALKSMYYEGRFTRAEMAETLKISTTIVEEVLHALMRDGFATTLGAEDHTAPTQVYGLTSTGASRAEEALARHSYVGPAPVSFAAYVEQVQSQKATGAAITSQELQQALGGLVLNDRAMRTLSWAAASRKPMLVHGESGNGKTTLALAIGAAMHGTIRLPYAIEVAGQIVRIFDESKHEVAEETIEENPSLLRARRDRRWIEVKRPVIWAGGELTRASLELMYDQDTRIYEAPLQLKANGGVLIVDDLGRQQIPAIQLLNRWIVALESGTDHLTLHTGQMIEIPFDAVLVFSTNLPPKELADEAFLRRIRYKVRLDNPDETEYKEIFRRECASRGIRFEPELVDSLLATWYAGGRERRGCHPRDLLEAIEDRARVAGVEPVLTTDVLEEACRAYFL
jgi:predicted ATPase with chaperone activity